MAGKAIILPTFLLLLASVFPVTAGKLKFVPIFETLTIKANKKLPPHMAYVDSYFESNDKEWAEFERSSKQPLAVGMSEAQPLIGPYVLTQKRDLEGFTIRKSPELIAVGAQKIFNPKTQNQPVLDGTRWLKNMVADPLILGREAAEDLTQNLTTAKRVLGPIELTKGLAVTNEHHIEVRRADEGVFREMGRVDLVKGHYSIDINEASGAIVARLMDKAGAILGEGQVRLNQLQIGEGRLIFGPRLEIVPHSSSKGQIAYRYPQNKRRAHITTFGSQNPVRPSDSGEINLDNVTRGSTTVVRAAAENHFPTVSLVTMGAQPFEVPLFPVSMIEALKSIISDQQRTPLSRLDSGSVVLGTVSLDGKPISGVTVISESQPEAKVIYFNDFLIPDPNLKATGTSGQFVFVDLEEGFHALLAQRGDAYFGHKNVVVEVGSIAVGDIESTLYTEPVKLRAFDAFSGSPISTLVNLQGLSSPVELFEGVASAIMPQVSRLSMAYPEVSPEYIQANYFYNDEATYIHLPMLPQAWLSEIKTAAKINEQPDRGTVVGFFADEKFEAYLASTEPISGVEVIYFDASGRIVEGNQGQEGGGFVMFNVPNGVKEVVLIGSETEKIQSRVVPVDSGSVSVLSFSSY